MSNPLSLASAWAALSIPFGPGAPQPITFDASIHPRLKIDSTNLPFAGIATPFGYAYDPKHFDRAPWVHQEELDHIKQWEALGPLFPLALGMTVGGDPFEPYDPRSVRTGGGFGSSSYTPDGSMYSAKALDDMWMPTREQERQFPQFRLTIPRDGTAARADFMPGYREGIGEILRLVSDLVGIR
jgi:hypothetical protein